MPDESCQETAAAALLVLRTSAFEPLKALPQFSLFSSIRQAILSSTEMYNKKFTFRFHATIVENIVDPKVKVVLVNHVILVNSSGEMCK